MPPKKPVEPPPKLSIKDQLKQGASSAAAKAGQGVSGGFKTIGGLFWQILIYGILLALVMAITPIIWDKFLASKGVPMHSVVMQPGVPIDRTFLFTDQHGKAVSNNDFATKAWAVFFGYSHCPDTCPVTLSRLSNLWGQMNKPDRIQMFFVTVDPERDTVEALADYMKAFDPRLEALTGPPVLMEQMRNNFHVYAKKVQEPGSSDYSMDHTATTLLLRSDGVFMGTIDVDESDAAALAKLNALTGG